MTRMRSPEKSTLREYFESIIIAVILALFIRTWVVQAFKIPTGSMEENLLVGDHLLVNKFAFSPTMSEMERNFLPIKPVRRGDVVVFKYPENPGRDFIKRVIGLPGETLEVRRTRVFINGEPIGESYIEELRLPSGAPHGEFPLRLRDDYGPVTIPPGEYFVMGDNRDNSQDSRYWGFMPHSHLKGKALMVYWSYDAPETNFQDQGNGFGSTFRGILSVAINFFTGTRWERLFSQIR